jgi:hypothetical protein
MVAAMWDQSSGLETHSPELAKPAESGPCIPVWGRRLRSLVNSFSPTFPSFASDFLPRDDLRRFPASSAGC